MKELKRTRRHHIVPQVLQRTFCNPDGRLWYSEHDIDQRFLELSERTPKGCFWKRDYYSILEGDALSDVVEREFYGRIDNFLGNLLPEVMRSFSAGFVPNFERETLDRLKKVIFEMIKRTPDFLKKLNDIETGREIVQAELYKDPQLSASRKAKLECELACEVTLKNLGRNVRVQGVLRRNKKVEDALSEFQVRWARIQDGSSFILSSQMAYRIGNGGPNGLINPDMEIWMPISPKLAVVLVRDPSGKIPLVVSERRDHVRKVNLYAIDNSFAVASRSSKLLHSLIRDGWR